MTAPPSRRAAPEAWLRGPVPGIALALQPLAHTFIQVDEELRAVLARVGAAGCWTAPPIGGWSVGQHVLHMVGSTDRLMTYAQGLALSVDQQRALAEEQQFRPGSSREPDLPRLLDGMRTAAIGALEAWSQRPPDDVHLARQVGRARLPSTALGLLYHAAEHAQRHAGQVAVVARSLSTVGSE